MPNPGLTWSYSCIEEVFLKKRIAKGDSVERYHEYFY